MADFGRQALDAGVVAGYPVAYLISSMDRDRKARWVFWVLLSFWTSFLVRAFAVLRSHRARAHCPSPSYGCAFSS